MGDGGKGKLLHSWRVLIRALPGQGGSPGCMLSLCLLASSYFVPCHHHGAQCDLSHSRAVAWSHPAHLRIGKGRAGPHSC